MVRITFVSFYGLDEPNVASVRLKHMVAYFKKIGWEVAVITPSAFQTSGKIRDLINLARVIFQMTQRSLAKRATTDVYFLSAPPFAMIWPALFIGLLSRKVMFLEERDLLSVNSRRSLKSMGSNVLARIFEYFLLRKSHSVVVASQNLKDALEKKWPSFSKRNPVNVVASGFWKDDYSFLQKISEERFSGPLRITHVGNFYGSQTPLPLIEALKIFRRKNPKVDLSETFRFTFYGIFTTRPERERFFQALADEGLSEIFEINGPAIRPAALKELALSDVSLLVTPHSSGENTMPAKMLEYIAVGRPILAITRDPLVLESMKKYSLGWSAPHDQPRELATKLFWLSQNREKVRHMTTGGLNIAQYDAEVQLEQLKSVILGRQNEQTHYS